jgi:3-hydroxyisobutyrate dehydrogenase
VKIGWIGLGMIGTAMVKRLLATGFEVTVYERGRGLEQVRSAGARTSGDYQSLAATCDLLTLCVYNDAQVQEVLLGSGALAAMRANSVLAIHTTGSPALMREIAQAAPAGVTVLDATFSGGPDDAAAAGLTLMVGGNPRELERVRPAFAAYARRIDHLGAVGSGQVIKLLNNLLFAANLMYAAHVLELAGKQDFDPVTIASIIGTCSGASYAMARFQSPQPTGALLARVRPYLEKDVTAAMRAAKDGGLDVSAFDGVADYFRPSDKR